MTHVLRKTEDALARSRNRAVLPLLAAALESSSLEVRTTAIRAIIKRVDMASHTQLIRHFGKLGDAEKAVFSAAHRATPHHAAPAIKAAVNHADRELCANACAMVLTCGDLDLFPTLVKAAENPKHYHAQLVIDTILQLAGNLHEQLVHWAAHHGAGDHDPSFVRHRALAALEHAIGCYAKHKRREIVDAFVLLAPIDNELFLGILRDPQHLCHGRLVESLESSDAPAILELLVHFLRDAEAPTAVLEVIARRTDRLFVHLLLHDMKHPVPLRAVHNMARLKSVSWLEAQCDMLLEFNGRAQATAVDLAMASGVDRAHLFELLSLLLRSGLAEGRRASCQALAGFNRPEADELVSSALNDPDSGVQAAAVRQLRPRKLPNALKMLVALLNSPSIEVRDAARSSLAEFNFIRYRAMFDLLDEHAVRTTGVLVRQVDSSACEKLIEELTSPSVTTRLRGIEMAVAMEAVDDLRDALIEMSRHENAALRKEAVTALAGATGPAVIAALESATHDSAETVAEAARQSLSQVRSRETAGKHAALPGEAK